MRHKLLALGLYAVAAIHPAQARPIPPLTAPASPALVADAPRPAGGWERADADKREAEKPEGDLSLATRLAALEVRLGIKASQLDAWRSFSHALQNMLAADHPAKPNDPPHTAEGSAEPKDPFDRPQKLADDLIRRAAEAEKLKAAIKVLRGVLTPPQLEALAIAGAEGWLRAPKDGKAARQDDRPANR